METEKCLKCRWLAKTSEGKEKLCLQQFRAIADVNNCKFAPKK